MLMFCPGVGTVPMPQDTGDPMRRPALYIPPRTPAAATAREPLPAHASEPSPAPWIQATATSAPHPEAPANPANPPSPSPASTPARQSRWPAWAPAWISAAALLVTGLLLGWQLASQPHRLTQQDIDAAVRHSLETQPLRSAVATAAERVAPSVVRVVGFGHERADRPARQGGTRGRTGARCDHRRRPRRAPPARARSTRSACTP